MPEEIEDGLDAILENETEEYPDYGEEERAAQLDGPAEDGDGGQPQARDAEDQGWEEEKGLLTAPDLDDDDDYADAVVRKVAYVQSYAKAVVARIKNEVGELPPGFAERYEATLLSLPTRQLTPQAMDLYVTHGIGELARRAIKATKGKSVPERTPPVSTGKKTNPDAAKFAKALGLPPNAFDGEDL